MKGNIKENIIHIIKVITGQDYKELKGEWEQQNITIDKLTLEKTLQEKRIKKLNSEVLKLEEEAIISTKTINELRDILEVATEDLKNILDKKDRQIKKLEQDLKKKEKQRHSSASKNGAYVVEIEKLKAQVEFLKKHRRSPSLDELKDYTLRRKSVCKKK